jgi:hypothetical protein
LIKSKEKTKDTERADLDEKKIEGTEEQSYHILEVPNIKGLNKAPMPDF